MKVAVVKETAPGERRVALVPETMPGCSAAGLEVLVERARGRRLARRQRLRRGRGDHRQPRGTASGRGRHPHVGRPDEAPWAGCGPARRSWACSRRWSTRSWPPAGRAGVTAISLDGLPRTLSRAQGMDALSSQANVAGYKAALVAAEAVRPVLPAADHRGGHRAAGQGAHPRHRGGRPAGDRHRAAARRRGSAPTTCGRRPRPRWNRSARTFIELTSVGRRGGRGRLRPGADRRGTPRPAGRAGRAYRPARRGHHHRPGARAPAAAARHRGRAQGHGRRVGHRGHGRRRARRQRGRLGAGRDDRHRERGHHHRGRRTCRATVPAAASAAFSRNISALLLHMIADGALAIDLSDEIQAGVVITHDGAVVQPARGRSCCGQPPARGSHHDDGPAH